MAIAKELDVEVDLQSEWNKATLSEKDDFVDEFIDEIMEFIGEPEVPLEGFDFNDLINPDDVFQSEELCCELAWQISDETASEFRKWLDFYQKGL